MDNFYTGVGSRNTPKETSELINKISVKLESLGYILRSGGAEGADTFFSEKINNKEIFIPWKNFGEGIVPNYSEYADNLIKEVHPAYERLSEGAKKLHLRNVNQVLGLDLNTPSKFLICWAEIDKEGTPKGGTRTAWMVAKRFNIPCFNLVLEEDKNRFELWLHNG